MSKGLMLSYDDILLIPRKSEFNSRSEVDISVEFDGDIYSAPIVMSPMTCVTSPEMIHFFVKEKLVPTVHRYFPSAKIQYDYVYIGLGEQILLDKEGIHFSDWESRNEIRNNVVDFTGEINKQIRKEISKVYFAVGSVQKYKEWIDYLLSKGIKRFCVDMAHGHSKPCMDTIKYLKSVDKNIKVMAGNIATNDARQDLENCGVDSLRVGIGGGSSCSTSANTGFGVSSITSLQDTCKTLRQSQIIADGGIKTTGDMIKAMYFGSDMVMLGKMLASTDMASGGCFNRKYELIEKSKVIYELENVILPTDVKNLVSYKEYFGMASEKARKGVLQKGSIEGVSGMIKYTGTTENLIQNIKINMKSALSYGGCKNWKDLRKNVKYMTITGSSVTERKTHLDVMD